MTAKLTLRMPRGLHDRLAGIAEARGQSLNAWMTEALARHGSFKPYWDGLPPPGTAASTTHHLRTEKGELIWAWWDGEAWRIGRSLGWDERGVPRLSARLVRERLWDWGYIGPISDGPVRPRNLHPTTENPHAGQAEP